MYGDVEKSNYRNQILEENDLDLHEEVNNNTIKRDKKFTNYTAPKEIMDDIEAGEHENPFKEAEMRQISKRQDTYKRGKTNRPLSPER